MLEVRGSGLTYNVEKNQKVASEHVQGLYQHLTVWVGKESKVASNSTANGPGKFGKLLILSQTSVNG